MFTLFFRVQLAVCVSHLVKQDYPHKWPAIVERVAMYLQSDQHDTWLGALICLYQMVKTFEYVRKEFFAKNVILILRRTYVTDHALHYLYLALNLSLGIRKTKTAKR